MPIKANRAIATTVALFLLSTIADAQPRDPEGASSTQPSAGSEGAFTPSTSSAPFQTPGPLGAQDIQFLRIALDSARRSDVAGARNAMGAISDPVARRLAQWALVDAAAESLGFYEVERARGDLSGWPRGARRQQSAERLIATAGMPPARLVEWFGGADPATAEGAFALANALQATGKVEQANDLIRRFWRDKPFEADIQRTILGNYFGVLTEHDHLQRADMLLYGAQGPAARDMLALLPEGYQALARARMALRANTADAMDLASAVPAELSQHVGLAFEKAAYLRRRGLDQLALGMVGQLPGSIPSADAGRRIWSERYQLTLRAIRAGDASAAYAAAANTGLREGTDATEAEFYAGWIALSRLKDPRTADAHFANIERIGASPITRARALYWRGRAAEARGERQASQAFYRQAARYNTVFYGLLAAEKTDGMLRLEPDPPITHAERARFESQDLVRAMRILQQMGERNLYRVFALHYDDISESRADIALLVDMTRAYGDQDASMKVVRGAAQRGYILTERGYPLRAFARSPDMPEMALILGITRQESGFDPLVRSGVGARGMMQLMPATAQQVARNLGVSYTPGQLDDPDYNMRLGSTYLGQMIRQFGGSYPMAIAAYNAGPGRPAQWVSFCGDPRGGQADPVDFIECIPFRETRNYVMRVMEGMQVYRARLSQGPVRITLSQDLSRGSYAPPAPIPAAAPGTAPGDGTMAPIPD